MTRRKEKVGLFSYLGIILMILGLLLAGFEVANSQEELPFPEDPLHLGNIQELGTSFESKINLLKEDRERTLAFIRSFREKELREILKGAIERLELIESELILLSNQE